MTGPRVLVVDNHDSYTWNLHQLCWETTGREPTVVGNDESTVDALLAGGFTHVLISPGPGTPHRPADVGICPELLRRVDVPCLGVCLGHQLLAAAYGARVVPAATVMHGRRSRIRHAGTGLFAGLPQDFPAVRYHSLVVPRPLPVPLVETARADDGVVMGLSHPDRPLHGVQFHPESVGTPAGAALVANFLGGSRRRVLDLGGSRGRVLDHGGSRGRVLDLGGSPGRVGRRDVRRYRARAAPPMPLRVRWRQVRSAPPAQVFAALFRDAEHAFWLDSARQVHGMGRYSFLGAGRPGSAVRDLEALRPRAVVRRDGYDLPFAGGWVGRLGYAATARSADAEFVWADRLLAVDAGTGRTYAVTLGLDPAEADRWLDRTAAALDTLPASWLPPEPGPVTDVRSSVDRTEYGAHLAEVDRWLRRGESYEACYTYRITARSAGDPLAAYLRLRRDNPAPYAAYLRSGDRHLLSSSPERFLTVDAGGVAETKPIKGTAARDDDPERDRAVRDALARDEKNRSENLMIVDLLRNDLGRVCLPGTVQVPALLAIESYATVHHLVSTVRGRLRPDADVLDCLAALFPGGSMTGAPKERTVALLAGLETTPRGLYAGCLGYIGPDGVADLSIVIRTAVWEGDRITVGVGGAVTALSDVAEEWAETEVKALAVLRALGLDRAPLPG